MEKYIGTCMFPCIVCATKRLHAIPINVDHCLQCHDNCSQQGPPQLHMLSMFMTVTNITVISGVIGWHVCHWLYGCPLCALGCMVALCVVAPLYGCPLCALGCVVAPLYGCPLYLAVWLPSVCPWLYGCPLYLAVWLAKRNTGSANL